MSTETLAYPFYCIGGVRETIDEAWESFYADAEAQFNLTDGIKVWRFPPKLYSNFDIPTNTQQHVVKARALVLTSLPNDVEEAQIRGPYPDDPWPNEKNYPRAIGF